MTFLRAFLLALSLLLASFAALSTASAAEGDDAARIIALVNEFRVAHGLAPVALDSKLSAAAQEHAKAMAASGRFSHDAPDGNLTERMRHANYAFATVAENIAAGAPTPEEVEATWEQSLPHARNLLNASVRDAGVGHARGADETSTDYWCLILAEPAPP